MKHLLWIGALLLCLCAPGRSAAQQLVFADTVQLVGELAENDAPRSYTFVCENQSDKPIVILRVDTSCGCVKVSHTRKPIAPGERGEVVVTLDPRGHEGALYKQMPLYTSASGRRPAVRLALSGVIRPPKRPAAQ
ncbi:MAG: DUF1573 domain-containing protein [Clostridiales bacterium]|nr:DUF1573 domain-containing protein [Clostridiales bacterium]